jgi:K+-sensing histidine kinase KdpD
MVKNSPGADLAEQRNNFIDTLSHDLKIPLLGAGRVLDLLAEGKVGESNDEREKLLLQLRDNNRDILQRINEIIDAYRYLAELQSERKSFCSIDVILQTAVANASSKAKEKNITINLENNFTDLFKTKGEAISKLFDNLLDNSIRTIDPDGVISIKTSRLDHRMYFELGDTGPGLHDGDKAQLFTRMWRSTGFAEASRGMNLYICGEIIRDLGGEIKADNDKSQSTKLILWLPMRPEKSSITTEES